MWCSPMTSIWFLTVITIIIIVIIIVCINTFENVFSKSIILNFADDGNPLFPSKNLGYIESVMNHEQKVLV